MAEIILSAYVWKVSFDVHQVGIGPKKTLQGYIEELNHFFS